MLLTNGKGGEKLIWAVNLISNSKNYLRILINFIWIFHQMVLPMSIALNY